MRAFILFKRRLKCSYQQSKRYCSLASRLPKEWQAVIGLEIHAQISTKSKLFSGAATQYGATTNEQVAYLDAALPGTLPVINKQCVKAAVLTALALNSQINLVSRFDRKHYFYADLPAGYQITQQRQPVAVGGHVDYPTWVRDGKKRWMEQRRVRITQLQLEQDSGKSLHDPKASVSLIDLNRAGIGLMEIVTEPDFRTPDEAAGFVRELQQMVRKLGTCDGKMAEGSLRVDASVSVHHPGEPFGTRAEVKNINSARFVARAIEYEVARQIDILEQGEEVTNETRNYDYETGVTIAMRDKEKLHDYRFMPEPNLPPLRLYTNDTLPQGIDSAQIVNVDKLREEMTELPCDVRARLQNQYGIPLEKAVILAREEGFAEMFELAMQKYADNVELVLQFSIVMLLGVLDDHNVSLPESRITHGHLIDVFELLCQQKIMLNIGEKILDAVMNGDNRSVADIVEENNWSFISDDLILKEICADVVKRSPKFVKDFVRYQKNPKKRERVVSNFVKVAYTENSERFDIKQITPIMRELLEKHL